MKIIIYNPATGEITGRVSCNENQAVNYPHRLEVSAAVYESAPETWAKVENGELVEK